jgi:hypothetical protein
MDDMSSTSARVCSSAPTKGMFFDDSGLRYGAYAKTIG